MSRDGSGTYTKVGGDAVFDTVISETYFNAQIDDIASALTNSVAVDGQSTMSAALKMGTNKITGMAVGSASTDSVTLGQAQAEAFIWCGTMTGTADAGVLTPSPAITAYAAGQRFAWKASTNANTGAMTIAISGLSTIAAQNDRAALSSGDHAASDIYMGILDTTSTIQIMKIVVPASAGIAAVVDDTTPQLGGQLDVNGQAIGDGTRELLTFVEDGSAVNHVNIENQATGGGPIVSAVGDDTNIDLLLDGKGTGGVDIVSYLKQAKGGDIASNSPCVIDTDGSMFDITGTTGFAAFTVAAGRYFTCQFDGALTITHGSGIELAGAANLTTAAGDRVTFYAVAANSVIEVSRTLEAPVAAGSGGLVFLDKKTASTSTSLDFTSLMTSASYGDYLMTFHGMRPVTDAQTLQLTFSTDNGSTWETGGSGDHAYQEVTYTGTASDGGQNADEVIDICRDCSNVASNQQGGQLFIINPHGSSETIVNGMLGGVPSAGGFEFRSQFGCRNADDEVNAIRIAFSSGSISAGTVTLFGIVNS